MRGDDPSYALYVVGTVEVFPACAGMILSSLSKFLYTAGVPRMRGDDPAPPMPDTMPERCSPHARG